MKSFEKKTVLLILAFGFAVSAYSDFPEPGRSFFRKHSSDTSELNTHIRKALNSFSKSKDPAFLKANIDTAELLCVRRNVEFPASLHLARARYFLLTNDFRNASQEATLALKKAKSSGETDILARTLSFLGQYSFRTGFSMESISYYENSVSVAKKNKLKGLIPANYNMLYDVYDKLGNLKEARNTLNKLIVSAGNEKDTLNLEMGYLRLGRTFARDSVDDKERDYNQSDSLLKKSLEISLKRQDTVFIVRSLALLGWNFYLEKKYDDVNRKFD